MRLYAEACMLKFCGNWWVFCLAFCSYVSFATKCVFRILFPSRAHFPGKANGLQWILNWQKMRRTGHMDQWMGYLFLSTLRLYALRAASTIVFTHTKLGKWMCCIEMQQTMQRMCCFENRGSMSHNSTLSVCLVMAVMISNSVRFKQHRKHEFGAP